MTASRCVVQGCNNSANLNKGISVHKSPKNAKRRAKWFNFVYRHRKFNPDSRFVVCSLHFHDSCFTRQVHIPGCVRILKPGSIPTIWKPQESKHFTERERRQVSLDARHTESLFDVLKRCYFLKADVNRFGNELSLLCL